MFGSFLIQSVATPKAHPVATIVANVKSNPLAVSPLLYGIFFEEINLAGDGGLYAEMIRNRSFENPNAVGNWSPYGGDTSMKVSTEEPKSHFDSHSLRLVTAGAPYAQGIQNSGFYGFSLQKGAVYDLTVIARTNTPGIKFSASWMDQSLNQFGASSFIIPGSKWSTIHVKIKATATVHADHFVLASHQQGTTWFDYVSLIPAATETAQAKKNGVAGLRPDLLQKLKALHPAFMRFPGGCWIEGNTLETQYIWKNTIGPDPARQTLPDLWGYTSPNGLGYLEYLELCDYLKCKPLFVINCGMGLHGDPAPISDMGSYVQNALDAIEYANGSVKTKWGAQRAKDGHPKPFNLQYMEIGNENGGAVYGARWPLFYHAIKKRYPKLHLINPNWGGIPTSAPVEIEDDHFYSNPGFFEDGNTMYLNRPFKAPKVYVGEYAMTESAGTGNLIGAVSEAAFMAGFEQSNGAVVMSSYAPLFANVRHRTWTPDLINFDGASSYGTPSYGVQWMFSNNTVKSSFQTTVNETAHVTPFPQGGIGIGTWNSRAEFRNVTMTTNGKSEKVTLTPQTGQWSTDPSASNLGSVMQQTSLAEPALATAAVSAQTYSISLEAKKLSGAEGFLIQVGAQSPNVYEWWNIGGWGNSQTAIEQASGAGKGVIGPKLTQRVVTGRWYKVRVDFSPTLIKCYLDGKLMETVRPTALKSTFATVGESATQPGALVVKLINTGGESAPMAVNLKGLATGFYRITGWLLTGQKPQEENSLADPNQVRPVPLSPATILIRKGKFQVSVPKYGVEILTLSRAAKK